MLIYVYIYIYIFVYLYACFAVLVLSGSHQFRPKEDEPTGQPQLTPGDCSGAFLVRVGSAGVPSAGRGGPQGSFRDRGFYGVVLISILGETVTLPDGIMVSIGIHHLPCIRANMS